MEHSRVFQPPAGLPWPRSRSVIVTGYPGAGKTTLAKRLAPELGIPAAHRDEFKELLFDELGASDREWSRKLGSVSYELLWQFAQAHFAVGQPCLLESNFVAHTASPVLQRFSNTYGVEFAIVSLHVPQEILERRFFGRLASGKRHPGHCDDVWGPELMARTAAQGAYVPPCAPGIAIDLPASSLDDATINALAGQLRRWLQGS